jgi:hypothetical protein
LFGSDGVKKVKEEEAAKKAAKKATRKITKGIARITVDESKMNGETVHD